MNALKHGRETAERREFRRRALLFLRLNSKLRRMLVGLAPPDVAVVRDLTVEANWLERHSLTSSGG